MRFYIFYLNEGDWVYERTSSDKYSTEARVKELKRLYDDACYFENEIPKDFKYFY